MAIRTDLAIEAHEAGDSAEGVEEQFREVGGVKVTTLKVTSESASHRLGKPEGTYITCEFRALTDDFTAADERLALIGELIGKLVPKSGCVLVAGIGNSEITPDALGPKVAAKVLATRHITGETAKTIGIEGLRSVCVISPGVLGQTGFEAGELIGGAASMADVSCVIAVDALASRRLSRLGCTVQISDTGISPGSGVGNHRAALNEETLGVPVVSVGVPTVVDAATLARDIAGDCCKIMPEAEKMIVTPREIDLLTARAATLIGMAINVALQPSLSAEDIFSLTS